MINNPTDLGCLRRLEHLEELQAKARAANHRLVDAERVGQDCVLASPAFERVALSSVNAEGRRAPALRFGDPRVMALVGALCIELHTVVGITNRSLRAQVAALWGQPYSTSQMSYDLGKLRLNGMIERLAHSNTYVPTEQGQRIAIFYTKVHDRLRVHCWPPTPRPPQPTSAKHCPPSTNTSGTTPNTRGSTLPENSRSTSTS